MKKNILILLTDNFPVGNSEPYLVEEYQFLTLKFDSVLLISTFEEYNDDNSNKNNYNFFFKKNKGFKPKEIFVALMNDEVLKEIFKLLLKRKLTFYKVKLILNYFIRAIWLKNKVINLINKQKIGNENILIYSYWCDERAIAAGLIKNKLINCKAISRAHGWDLYTERSPENYLPFRNFIIEKLDKIYCISLNGKEYLTRKHKKFAHKIELNRLGSVPINNIPTKAEIAKFRILSIAYLVPLKRIEKIIYALGFIDDFEVEWVHIGGGPQMETIQNLAIHTLQNKLNIKFDFIGNLAHHKIIAYLSLEYFDLFLNVSETEGLPVSIMESMSVGIPVIATNVGGTSEIVNDQNGYLIDKDTSDREIANILKMHFKLDFLSIQQKRANALQSFNFGFNSKINYSEFAEKLIFNLQT